jgi:hypothetical protein
MASGDGYPAPAGAAAATAFRAAAGACRRIRFARGYARLQPCAMDREARIQEALARRNFSPFLSARIVDLLDGREDRTRLSCCHSGCFVCIQELLAILGEVEAGRGGAADGPAPAPAPAPAPDTET